MPRRKADRASQSTRRNFLKTTGAAAVGLSAGTRFAAGQNTEQLALHGGPKAVTLSDEAATRWPLYGKEEEEAVLALVRNPGYGVIKEFEKEWADFHGMPYAKAHFNGTSALTSMMFALDLPPGSEVLVASYSTWFPLVPARFFGLVPRFVDVDPRTINIDVEDAKKRLTKNTRAILAVHWYGVPCEMDRIVEFAKEHDLIVLEDCSHAHGAAVKGKLVGTWGRMSAFSLQMGKPLPAIEGGMAMYHTREDFERATVYGNYDLPNTFPADSPYRKYHGTAFGSKLRIHPMAAALARCQLKRLKEYNTAGVAQLRRLNDRLTQLPGLTEQYARPDMDRVVYANNLLFIDEAKAGMSREAAVAALRAEGVPVGVYKWVLLHTMPLFQEAKWWHHLPENPGELPGSNQVNKTLIKLPHLTREAPELVDQWVRAFEKVWAHRKQIGKA
ncbi:MAG TPA: DegT/DnrJ/EryC1/StrS family aminotransferase [Phycisphaerae bacterium]|jgi:perosamine synthetase|nr:twin-arginine translocation signal domain-containing protein [Phycisphaerae bacterium]HOB73977.1 DegT/DnrJ/EryC1/StrS family aminotransferase [Phycisphaerae bacterium]HOJ53892.1 DegT/DnrJ/EryC1/StrS family aminotransferase [Phycisphaerae bacterium]HOL26223.1 DegT/DnrJ/EryC1/StrS family aminotransferase [Phycisphaerae bacterium]HPP20210.1 DegT/DnrJ/EryC1/StrS family aminotransferase [Phycisphaerae bacterium]